MQKFISYIALNQMKFREFIREHVQSWTCCLAVTSCMDFWKRFQFHCLRETWILRSETLIWFRKHDSECGETNDQINATQLLNLWSTKVAFDNGTKFTLFEPRKKMKQVWKIWLQQVWKNMIDFFSCLLGMTHAKGLNHVWKEGFIWQWNQLFLVWLTQTVRIIFQQKVWCDNGIKFTWFDWGKRFESSFNRRFDLTMESRWLALIHFVVWIIFEGQTHLKHRRDVTETMHLQRMMDQDVQLWLDQKVWRQYR